MAATGLSTAAVASSASAAPVADVALELPKSIPTPALYAGFLVLQFAIAAGVVRLAPALLVSSLGALGLMGGCLVAVHFAPEDQADLTSMLCRFPSFLELFLLDSMKLSCAIASFPFHPTV